MYNMKAVKLRNSNSQLKQDKLYQIFEKYLFDDSKKEQSHEELIFDVVAEYILYLMNVGNVPHTILDTLEVDLKEEVLELYRKKTYGFLSLQEFRSQALKKWC
jgi:hypothetical protein